MLQCGNKNFGKRRRNLQVHCIFCFAETPCPPGKKTDDAQGRCCVFPFTYDGKSYSSCTTVDNGNKPWCSFDAVYRGQWANCGKKRIRLQPEKCVISMKMLLSFEAYN